MGLSIRAADPSYLDFDGGNIQGTATAGAGQVGSVWISRASAQLCWQASANTQVQARTTSAGFTGEPDGSLWISGGSLRFALGGVAYQVQARPYTALTLRLDQEFSDGNFFGSSTSTVALNLNGAPYTVPAGYSFRLVTFQSGMTSYDYAGPPSFNWQLLGSNLSGSANGIYRSGTPDAPLATYAAGQQLNVQVVYNNLTTHGCFYAVYGVLVPN